MQAVPEILWAFRVELVWILAGSVVAGVVRGFSGFGTAMIFLPIASSVVEPVWSLIILCVMDIIGPLILSGKVAKDTNPKELLRLSIGAAVGMPFGLVLLGMLTHDMFRNAVSILALTLVAVMATGWRHRGTSSDFAVFGIGGFGGLLAGSTGVPGPPVMLFYLARPLPPANIRANIFMYLIIADVLLLAMMAFRGWLSVEPLLIGSAATITYLAAIRVGMLFFRPDRERQYRFLAYAIIAAAALLGLAGTIG